MALTNPLRVLVTDDELGMRKGVARILHDFTVPVPEVHETVSLTIMEADCGEAALEQIQNDPPDLLILDHKMPGISGLDVLDRLVEQKSEILTIMITAYASIETAVMATKRGAYDFLAKPFTPEELRGTVRKAAVRAVLSKQARQLAEERREIRLQFTRMLAHELQAPLSAIEGYLSMMADRSLGDDLAAYDQAIQRSQLRIVGMRKLIHDLLDMTQIESGRRRREVTDLDLDQVARHAMETLASRAAARKITLQLCEHDSVSISADRTEVEMVFHNLLSNAIKYNRPGGRVQVDIARAGDTVTISVSDTGIGISEAETERVFDEFQRVRNEQTRDVQGSGLGLSIVKKIAQAYQGQVTVESQLEEGSTFHVTLHDTRLADVVDEVS